MDGNAVSVHLFREEFPSTVEAMAEAIDRATDALVEHGWDDIVGTRCFRLCLEEAMMNAIRHGNQCDATRQVKLDVEAAGEELRVLVYDEGRGFDPDKIVLPDCCTEGGRGICLIKHYCDDMRYDTKRHCLEIAFRAKGEVTDG